MATQYNPTTHAESYADVFREVTTSAKQLITSEIELVKVELKDLTTEATSHIAQAILFGALLIVSVIPLLAAAVIALGNYWDGNYALSSLVVGLACAVVGGIFAYRAINKLTNVDVMPATQSSIAEGTESVKRKTAQVADAVQGEKNYEIH